MRTFEKSEIRYESLTLSILGLRPDNYTYVIHDSESQETLVIDPSETQPVIKWLDEKNYKLHWILDTHHHHDHIEGNVGLKDRFRAKIAASTYDIEHGRITGKPDLNYSEGDAFHFGRYRFRVLRTPGHTLGHIAFFVEGAQWLFSGDTVFSLGCGRLFEGTAEMLWQSFQKIRDLPDDTLLFCGHEYTLANARFIESKMPNLEGFADFKDSLEKRLKLEQKTVPSRLGDEKRFNPYFLADDPRFQSLGKDPVEVFAHIRQMKDNF